jgi:hypothetical protein
MHKSPHLGKAVLERLKGEYKSAPPVALVPVKIHFS